MTPGTTSPTLLRRASRRRWRQAAALGAALIAVLGVGGCATDTGEGAGYSGVVRDTALSVGDRRLPDVTEASVRGGGIVDGGELQLRAGDGRILVVYFGFTSCPDVCPTTLADLRAGLREIDPRVREKVDIAFVTVDPDRDTAEVLNRYMAHFFDRFHVLRGSEDEVRAVGDAFLASFAVETISGRVEVSHTAVLYAVDAAGEVRIEWPFGTDGAALGEDITRLYTELYGAPEQ